MLHDVINDVKHGQYGSSNFPAASQGKLGTVQMSEFTPSETVVIDERSVRSNAETGGKRVKERKERKERLDREPHLHNAV